MKNSNGFVRKSATEAFCQWATLRELKDLKEVLQDTDGLMHDAKRRAARTMVRLGDATVYPDLVLAMSDFVIRNDLRDAMIEVGAAVEPAILENYDKVTDASAKRELLEILKKVGTASCEKFLETESASGDGSVRNAAQQALDAVRSRL